MGASVQLATDRQISALRAAAAPYEMKIVGSRGLSLRVYPSSSRQFELRYLAVLSICMDMARRPGIASSHMDILAKAGLDLAQSGLKIEVERWISGFR
jgi:hypothetical protein